MADTIIVVLMCIPMQDTINKADTTFLTPKRIHEMMQASKEAVKLASDKTRRIREETIRTIEINLEDEK